MSTTSPRLRLHLFNHHEHGLMVIGSVEALRSLGQQLRNAGDARPDQRNPDWPALVARQVVESPYRDIDKFELSFHVAGDRIPPIILRRPRRTSHLMVFLANILVSTIGVFTIAHWFWSHI